MYSYSVINCGKKLGNQLANIIHLVLLKLNMQDCCFKFMHTKKIFIMLFHCFVYKLAISFTRYDHLEFYLTALTILDKPAFLKPRLIINIQNTTLSRLTITGIALLI